MDITETATTDLSAEVATLTAELASYGQRLTKTEARLNVLRDLVNTNHDKTSGALEAIAEWLESEDA